MPNTFIRKQWIRSSDRSQTFQPERKLLAEEDSSRRRGSEIEKITDS